MNLAVFNILENSFNAILGVEVPSFKVVSENRQARELLAIDGAPIRLSTLFFSNDKATARMKEVLKNLEVDDNVQIWDTEVMSRDSEVMACDMEFSYVNSDKTHLFLKVRPILDNKTFYLEKFIETRKRPAFTLSTDGSFHVGLANEAFYKAMACNAVSIETRYKKEFVRFLQEEGRAETEQQIRDAMKANSNGILDIPIQTAYGDVLWFYYDTKKLKQLEKETDSLMFCLLVDRSDTIADLTDPFDL